MKHAILVVDDEVDNVDALERLFRKKYKVFKAISGAEGLDVLKTEDVALIISDQKMPKMTGVEFLKKSIKSHPDTIRILLTGYTDIDSIIGAINSGEVYRYLTKPWDPVDLTNTVDKAIEKYELRHELEVKNIELKAALDELKTLDQAKNHFMVLINHELKTPLTSLLSFLELLTETNLDDEQKKYIDRIGKSSNKLKKIIDDVLELVSAETGLIKLSKKKLSSDKIKDFVTDKFAQEAAEKSQELIFDFEELNLKADQNLIFTVIQRLVDNAVKFGDNKSAITLTLKSTDNNTAEFSVVNKGKAIPEKTISKILKPFALDEDIMHHSAGLGLGLSLSQALLKQHESELELKSAKGLTTAGFSISLS